MTENDGTGATQPEPGSMRFQDGSSTPREPTLAEARAREQAARRVEEEAREQAEAAQRSRKKRKRILIGAGVTVGVVAIIAVGYAVSRPDTTVNAQCVDEETKLVVDDTNCATPLAGDSNRSSTYYGGGGFYPIFIGGGGRQYHYNYGGSGNVGQPAIGGTTVTPKDGTRINTASGSRTVSSSSGSSKAGSSSVSRGGLGVNTGDSSSSSGGSKGGSKSSGS